MADSKDARLEAVTLALFGAEFWPGVVPKGALENWATWELQARRFLAMYDAAHGYPVPERGGLPLGVIGERRDPIDGPGESTEEEVFAVQRALVLIGGWSSHDLPGISNRLAEVAIRALDEYRAKRGR